MRAELIDQTQFAVAGTEQHELFAQQLDPGGCTAGRRDFLGFGNRNPIAAHKLAHRLAFADLVSVLFSLAVSMVISDPASRTARTVSCEKAE